MLPRGGRSRKREQEEEPRLSRGARTPDARHGTGARECHAIMAIERVFRASPCRRRRHIRPTRSGFRDWTDRIDKPRSKRTEGNWGQPHVSLCDSLRISRASFDTHRRPGDDQANEAPGATGPVCPRELHISPLSPLYCCTLHGWQRGRRIATQHIPQGLHTPPRTWALSHG